MYIRNHFKKGIKIISKTDELIKPREKKKETKTQVKKSISKTDELKKPREKKRD